MTCRHRPLLAALALALVVGLAALPAQGKVVNANPDDLPDGCSEVSAEKRFRVEGGLEASEDLHGVVYTFSQHTFEAPTCARVTVTFENTDAIRHQFMVHGTYPAGFTLLEVDGQGNETATFITGSEANTLMIHCGLPQHQQKGMKAQLLVGGGVGDVPNVPTVSGVPDDPHATGGGEGGSIPSSLAASLLALAAAAGLAARNRS